MKFIIHSDDYGLTKGITDSILDAFDKGCLKSTSIIPNGYAFDYAIDEYKRRENFRLALHLNLLEGDPLSLPKDVSLLINANGKLKNSFAKLWLRSEWSSKKEKDLLRLQVKSEIRAQIKRVASRFDAAFPINIDSHQHFHMIPFISTIILELAGEFNIRFVRLPMEPSVFRLKGLTFLPDLVSPNLIKHGLLNLLSKPLKNKLDARGIDHADYFLGALKTGRMSEKVVRKMLDLIGNDGTQQKTIEILFHPGEAAPDEAVYWRDRPELYRYYYSPERRKEAAELKNRPLKELLEKASGK